MENNQQLLMMIALREKVFGMYIGQNYVKNSFLTHETLIGKINVEMIGQLARNETSKLVLKRLRDITPEHEDVFVDFVSALQTVSKINSNQDIETAVIAFSMASNRLRDLGYDCDGVINAGLAVDAKLVTIN